jgi:molecular chaperone DnaK (HSP70)
MPAYVLGIDLGTTNSVLAYAPLSAEQSAVELLPIPQLVAPGVVESRSSLPSFLYLAPEHEAKEGAFDLPWRKGNSVVVGELARRPSIPNERSWGPSRGWLIAKSIAISRFCRGKPRQRYLRFRLSPRRGVI